MKNLLLALSLLGPLFAAAQEVAPEVAVPKSAATVEGAPATGGRRRPFSQQERDAALKAEAAKKKAEAEAQAKAEAEARARAPAEAAAKRQAEEAAAAEAKAKETAEALAKKAAEDKRRQEAAAAGGRRVLVPGHPLPAREEPAKVVVETDPRMVPAGPTETAKLKVLSLAPSYAYRAIPTNGCNDGKSFAVGTLLAPFDGLAAGASVVLQGEEAASKKVKNGAAVVIAGLRRAGKAADGTFVYCGKLTRAFPFHEKKVVPAAK